MGYVIDNVHLPQHLETGAKIGPTFSTSIVTMSSGVEQANVNWQDERLEVDAGYGIMDKRSGFDPEDSYAAIVDFHRARWGRGRGFLFRDPSDCEAIDEPIFPIPTVAGRYQLAKSYDTYVRRLTRPVSATLSLTKGGEVVTSDKYTLHSLGQLSFIDSFNPTGVLASFDFDVPMRFVNDKLMASLVHIQAGSVPDIMLIQVRE